VQTAGRPFVVLMVFMRTTDRRERAWGWMSTVSRLDSN